MNEQIKKVLEKYEAACCEEGRVRDTQAKAKEEMDQLCAKERRALRRRVKKIMAEARPGWSLIYDNNDCHVSVNHIRPMRARISVSVRLLYCAGMRRGEARLYGDFDEMDALLAELRNTVGAVQPHD